MSRFSVSGRVSGVPCRTHAPARRNAAHVVRARPLVVRTVAHGPPAAGNTVEVHKNTGFVGEMRKVAMKLHTRDQAPKEGGKAASKNPMAAWAPTKEGYLQFLAQSKVVYDAFESIIATNDEYAPFRSNGLERGPALAADLEWFRTEHGLAPAPFNGDNPAADYVALIERLAVEDPPAFICHFYNFYFAHTAGGRMIGNKMSSMLLGGATLQFYQWQGEVTEHLEAVRAQINRMAETWTPEQREHCLGETASSFKYSGSLMRFIASGAH